MDINPILSRPVKRPHFVDPSTCVDVVHGARDHLLTVGIALMHGANYNDPAPFESPGFEQVMRSAFMQWSL
jgi:cyanobactin biosynthesis protein (PatB/AcyB/McaB family)